MLSLAYNLNYYFYRNHFCDQNLSWFLWHGSITSCLSYSTSVSKLRKMIYYSGCEKQKKQNSIARFCFLLAKFFTLCNPLITLYWGVGTPEKEMNSNMLTGIQAFTGCYATDIMQFYNIRSTWQVLWL
jgi:hypothetical protein